MAAKGTNVGIIAWGVAGLCAIVAVGLGLWGGQQAGRADGLRKAVVAVATTAGITEITLPMAVPEAVADEAGDDAAPDDAAPDDAAPSDVPAAPTAIEVTDTLLKDPAVLAQVVEETTTAIQTTQQNLDTTTAALASEKTKVSSAQNQVTTLSQQVTEQTTQAQSLSKELTVASEKLTTAQADLEQVTEEAKTAADAAEKQTARLEKTITRLKDEKAEAVAQLQAEIEVLKTPPAEEQDDGDDLDEAADGEAADVEPEPLVEEGRVIGASEMFSFIRYGEDQSLFFRLLDDQTLTYENVPPDVAGRLARAEDRLDVTYRFKIQGHFKSVPPDSVVIRKYWKWLRRHKARSDVRYAEPDVPVGQDEPATEEGVEE
ncbi:MAG: hypothetical protein RBT03_10755 [Kiritimatiellia bacterium]|jgi:hypothetical protein|nr:hypothetical protein [Kiritimatiellia bacterium]